jgi:L-fucose mutarotase/ribose pyranase (RbsD/FucU family)
MILKWFATAETERFGQELADFILTELKGSLHKRDAKFAAKAQKILGRAAGKVRDFQQRERMNFYKKAKLANAFLWALKDAGCPDDYANELTDWLTLRV